MSCHIVIVLGMHRSGTSAVAGYLHSLGLELPSEALSAHPQDNPEGYFEPQRMVQINNRLLAALGLNWQSTTPISPEELASTGLDHLREEIEQYLADTCTPGKKLMFKDPRLCRLLPVWLPIIEQYCKAPLVIYAVRSARAVADSLARRAEQQELAGAAITNPHKATLLWLRYSLDAWHHIKAADLPVHTLSYEQFSASKKTRRTLGQWLKNRVQLEASQPPSTPRPARQQPAPKRWPEDQDWQLLLAHAETCLITSNTQYSEQWLGALHSLAKIRIPARHQNEPVAPPPEDLVIAATIKHISGQQPKPLPSACPNPRWKALVSRLTDTASLKKANPATGQLAPEQPEFLFISENPTSRSHIYRVKNPVDALNQEGRRAAWITPAEALGNTNAWNQCQQLIIHRCEWSSTLASLYDFARSFGIPTVFDIDDYIFEPALIDQGHIDFINRLPDAQKQDWKAKTQRFRAALLAADSAMAPTRTLVSAIEQFGKPCILKPNGLSHETLALSEHWHTAFQSFLQQSPSNAIKRLGYASGTPTHEGDFSCFREAVTAFLNSNSGWGLTIIGALDTTFLDKNLTGSALQRLEHRPLVEHVNLPYELARLSLNLAPLQENNPFCSAKSPLKWFEAAACYVSTLATNTGAFASDITDGENGLLTANQAASNETLIYATNHENKLQTVANAAAGDARRHLTERQLVHNFMGLPSSHPHKHD
jgi:hypothetical protein